MSRHHQPENHAPVTPNPVQRNAARDATGSDSLLKDIERLVAIPLVLLVAGETALLFMGAAIARAQTHGLDMDSKTAQAMFDGGKDVFMDAGGAVLILLAALMCSLVFRLVVPWLVEIIQEFLSSRAATRRADR